MARCRCLGSGPCTCSLVAGDNITISGSGSEASPWMISAADPADVAFEVTDSSTVDLTVSGVGSVGDPYVLTAEADISPAISFVDSESVDFIVSGAGTADDPLVVTAGLFCIDCSLEGDVGDVLTLQVDGTYAPGPPAVVAPGEVIVSVGLDGDGTALNPLRVNVCTYDDLAALCGVAP